MALAPQVARSQRIGRGVWRRREHKDGPETWEAHELLCAMRESRPKARETGAEADGPWESEGRIRARTMANGWHPEPSEQRPTRVAVSFRRDP